MNPPWRHIFKIRGKGGFLFFIVFLSAGDFLAQSMFQKLYARTDSGSVSGINVAKQTSDGSYIIVGGISPCFNCSLSKAIVIKTDANGDTVWTKKMGGARMDAFNHAIETYDSGYLFAGLTTSFGKQATSNVYGEYIYLVKTNTNGDTLWTKIYGGINTDYSHNTQMADIKQTADSGFIITASVNVSQWGLNDDILIIKTNSVGDTLWTKLYGTNNGEYFSSVQQTADGGYVFTGGYQFITGTGEGLVVKADAGGNIQWQKTYGGTQPDYIRGVEITNSGDYITGGFTQSFTSDSTQVYMYAMRLNNLGDTVWTKIYGPVYNNRFINKINDSTYLLTGLSGTTHYGILAQKINGLTGNILFCKEYGSPGSVNGVDITNDGGFILGTETVDFGTGYSEGYVIKADATGNSGCYEYAITENTLPTQTIVQNANLQTNYFPIYVNSTQTQITSGMKIGTVCSNVSMQEFDTKEFKIYPNPASTVLNIKSDQMLSGIIEITNVAGEVICTSSYSSGALQINVGHLNTGLYFLFVKDGSGTTSNIKKIIVQR